MIDYDISWLNCAKQLQHRVRAVHPHHHTWLPGRAVDGLHELAAGGRAVLESAVQHGGLATGNTPWSGSYHLGKSLWANAQVAQFTQPGWKFLTSSADAERWSAR
jgi:hypothetical protein